MIVAGLPVESWLLIAAAVGIGLVLEVAFFTAHYRADRRRGSDRSRPPGDAGGDTHRPDRAGT